MTSWSDVLGNSASAIEIVRQFHQAYGGVCLNLSEVAEWCEEQAEELWGDGAPEDVDWSRVADELLQDAAEQRVNASPALREYEDVIFRDWPNRTEHLMGVAVGDEAETVDWCVRLKAEEEGTDGW